MAYGSLDSHHHHHHSAVGDLGIAGPETLVPGDLPSLKPALVLSVDQSVESMPGGLSMAPRFYTCFQDS